MARTVGHRRPAAPQEQAMPHDTSPGIVFPSGQDGRASSRRAGEAIVAAALGAVDPAGRDAALAEPNWRRAYPRHFNRLVRGAMRSADAAMASAQAGLDAAWATLPWQADTGLLSLAQALQAPAGRLYSAVLQGRGPAAPAPWQVPWQGAWLSGEALQARIADWQARGIIEPGAAQALRRCAAHPEWFDLSDRRLVLLGAGSEAGPLRWLTRWRAHILAVDVPNPAVWRRIAALVDQGNARLEAPVASPVAPSVDGGGDAWLAQAGADLLTQAPAVAAWLAERSAGAGPLDVAALGYLDGERHVRLALAMDMVQAACCAADGRTSLAWLATPTDVFAVPEATARRAMAAYAERPMLQRALQRPLRLGSGDRLFHPNVETLDTSAEGLVHGIVDSLVLEQGPNYALAKRLQQWRALRARAAGHRTSLNIAPSTTTGSVVKNPALAAGFAGASAFGVEVFEPATTHALMAALWVHDLRCDEAAANPARPLVHPHQLFMAQACHGGLWTAAYLPRSALPLAAALGFVRRTLGGAGHSSAP
jgi:hypothetical protein